MTISAVSKYRGGTIDEVRPIARALRAAYQRLGIAYRLSQVTTGPDAGDWMVVVTYADDATYMAAQAAIAKDPDCQQAFTAFATFAKRSSRELVTDVDL
jgi:hypothetical protein